MIILSGPLIVTDVDLPRAILSLNVEIPDTSRAPEVVNPVTPNESKVETPTTLRFKVVVNPVTDKFPSVDIPTPVVPVPTVTESEKVERPPTPKVVRVLIPVTFKDCDSTCP